jgi:hypothetical protein
MMSTTVPVVFKCVGGPESSNAYWFTFRLTANGWTFHGYDKIDKKFLTPDDADG